MAKITQERFERCLKEAEKERIHLHEILHTASTNWSLAFNSAQQGNFPMKELPALANYLDQCQMAVEEHETKLFLTCMRGYDEDI